MTEVRRRCRASVLQSRDGGEAKVVQFIKKKAFYVEAAADNGAEHEIDSFAEPETDGPKNSVESCFRGTETSKPANTKGGPYAHTLTTALDRSVEFDGTGFFTNRRDRRGEMTGTAYVLYKALQGGGDQAFNLAVARIPPGLRQRAPSRNKLELLAVQLTAKPRTTEERKACSSYASLLIVAQALGITTEGYRAWASGIDLADAEFRAKRIRAALQAAAPGEYEGDQAPARPIFELQVAVLVDGKRKEAMRMVIGDCRASEIRAWIEQVKATGNLTKFTDEITKLE